MTELEEISCLSDCAALKCRYGTYDHLGSTRMVLGVQSDNTVTVEEALGYYSYGEQFSLLSTSDDKTKETFTGKEFDQEGQTEGENGAPGIQAYHFWARTYDPVIGHWLSSDPILSNWNAFAYCGGNPINFIDPLGLFETWEMDTQFVAVDVGKEASGPPSQTAQGPRIPDPRQQYSGFEREWGRLTHKTYFYDEYVKGRAPVASPVLPASASAGAGSSGTSATGQFLVAMTNYLKGAGTLEDFGIGSSGVGADIRIYATPVYSVEAKLPYLGTADVLFGVPQDATYRVITTMSGITVAAQSNPMYFAIWKGPIPLISAATIQGISIQGGKVSVTYSGGSGILGLVGMGSGTITIRR